MVYNEVSQPDFKTRYAREVCRLNVETFDEACNKSFFDMVYARLGERYPSADWTSVSQHCRAYPLECKTALAVERVVLASHNVGVKAWYNAAVQVSQANAQYRYELAQRAEQADDEREAQRRADVRRVFVESLGGTRTWATPPGTGGCASSSNGVSTTTVCH